MKRALIGVSAIILLAVILYCSFTTVSATSTPDFLWTDSELYRQADKTIVVADVRLFTTMSIFNSIYGFDEEWGATMHPVREKVRAELEKRLLNIPKEQVERWKKFYDRKSYHLYHYVSYTMSLSEKYPFKPALPQPGNWFSRLQYRFWGLNGFEKIMNEFWVAMNLDSLWQEVLPDYIAEIDQWDRSRIVNEEGMVWNYVRKLNPKYNRYLVSVPNLIDSHYSAFALDYGTYYFAVSSPGSHNYGLNIHEYLHGVISSIIEEHYKSQKDKLEAYFIGAREMKTIKSNYNSLETFIEENMVRAIDLRIQIVNRLGDPQSILSRVEPQEEDGFNLIRVFYNLLQEYEQDHATFEDYIATIFEMVPYYQDYLRFK